MGLSVSRGEGERAEKDEGRADENEKRAAVKWCEVVCVVKKAHTTSWTASAGVKRMRGDAPVCWRM